MGLKNWLAGIFQRIEMEIVGFLCAGCFRVSGLSSFVGNFNYEVSSRL